MSHRYKINDSYSYQKYLQIDGEKNLLFFNEDGQKMLYKNFESKIELDRYFFGESSSLFFFIIKTVEAAHFMDALFGKERGYFKKGYYKYCENEDNFVNYEDYLKKYVYDSWNPFFQKC